MKKLPRFCKGDLVFIAKRSPSVMKEFVGRAVLISKRTFYYTPGLSIDGGSYYYTFLLDGKLFNILEDRLISRPET